MGCACGGPTLAGARVSFCAAREWMRLAGDGLDAALPNGVARRCARRRRSVVLESAFVRRVRVRLGVGQRVPALWPSLLSEARCGDPVYADIGTAAPGR